MRNVHKYMNEMDLRYIKKNETSRAKKIENERNAKKDHLHNLDPRHSLKENA